MHGTHFAQEKHDGGIVTSQVYIITSMPFPGNFGMKSHRIPIFSEDGVSSDVVNLLYNVVIKRILRLRLLERAVLEGDGLIKEKIVGTPCEVALVFLILGSEEDMT